MTFSYVRVSKTEQNLDRQIESVKKYRPDMDDRNIFADKKSGKNVDREEYILLKRNMRPGDELVIHELDRLGRNKIAVKEELEWFKQNRIRVRILDVPTTLIDFQGQEWIFDMINNILIEVMSSVAENERNNIIKRTKEGLEAARAKGKHLGRPKTNPQKINAAIEMHKAGKGVNEIAQLLGLSKTNVYTLVRAYDYQKNLEN